VDDVLSYDAPFWGTYDNQSLLMRDKIGEWGRPHARYEKWQLNSLGYRGPELRPGTVRIVCFGASETFGLYEAPSQEYARQLERDLNELARRPTFQVVNAAFPGETLTTATLRVPEVVSQAHPSYALIYPTPANYIEITRESTNPPPLRPRTVPLTDRVLELRITNRLRNVLKQALPTTVQIKLKQLQIERDAAHLSVMETLPQENVEWFREDLNALVNALREHQVEPVLVTHATVFGPTFSAKDQDLLISWRRFYPALKEDGFIDMERRMNEVIREIAVRENLCLIDAANEMPPGREYFADFVHFTTIGAGVIAADLTAGLKPLLFCQPPAQTWLPSADPPQDLIICNSTKGIVARNR
jgi:lysophospholipase L1-like esterase